MDNQGYCGCEYRKSRTENHTLNLYIGILGTVIMIIAEQITTTDW